MLEVRDCKYGRGVFAVETLPEGILVEESPILVFSSEEAEYILNTHLQLYTFEYNADNTCLAFGLGSLFNHSSKPNTAYRINKREQVIEFYTYRKIRKNSQLFIDYGYSMKDARNFEKHLEYKEYVRRYF